MSKLNDLPGSVIALSPSDPTTPSNALDFRHIVEQAEVGICITQDGLLKYVNPTYARMHGMPDAEMTGRDYLSIVHPDERERVADIIRKRARGQHHAPYESRNLRADGSFFDSRVFGCLIDFGGRPANLVSTVDVTEQAEARAELERVQNHDELTGLPTRRLLLQHARAAFEIAKREDRSLAMLYLHLAEAERVQEVQGLQAGDTFINLQAGRLAQALRAEDTLAYLGGGDFAVLLSPVAGAEEADVQAVAEFVLLMLRQGAVVAGMEWVAHAHIGVARLPGDAVNAAELLAQAHAACMRGGAGITLFDPEAGAKARRRAELESALRHALARGELSLQYQPQVDLGDGRIAGAEALLRWTSESFGEVHPDEFIRIAERSGLIVPLGDWVFRTACEHSVAWSAAGLPPLRISVNLSPAQLERPDISQRLQRLLLETGANPKQLAIEVTESMLLRNLEHARRVFEELSGIGLEIALDDFGTGYSNISTLRALPFDVLKIDRSLVPDVTAATEDVSVTRSVLALAKELKLKVLAEGVENEGQLALLISSGCDLVQGHVFSPALSVEAMTALLREGARLPERFLQRRNKQRTLLLVDDEESVLSSLRRLLRRDGYHIVIARNGPEGLAKLAEHDVDVIVSDQRMPCMTGVEFLRRAKALYPDTVRIVLSGYTELQSITDAVNEGDIYKFFTKPWDDELLRSHVAEAFRRKGLSDENQRLATEVRRANLELAESNQRQQDMLARQRDRLGLQESRAAHAQELLERLPAPLIGLDPDGTIVFVNAEARSLIGGGQALIGLPARRMLPADWGLDDSVRRQPRRVVVGGRRFVLSRAAMGDATASNGEMLALAPDVDA